MPDPTKPRRALSPFMDALKSALAPATGRPPATFEDSLATITGQPAKRGHLDINDMMRGEKAAYYYANDSLAAPDGWDASARRLFTDPAEVREQQMTYSHEMGHRIDPKDRGGNLSVYSIERDPRPYHRPDLAGVFDKARADRKLVGDTLPDAASFNAKRGPNEHFAEAFSQAVQFLRDSAKPLGANPRDDAEQTQRLRAQADRLAPGASELISTLLASEPIFRQHRLNQQQEQTRLSVRPDVTSAPLGLFTNKPQVAPARLGLFTRKP